MGTPVARAIAVAVVIGLPAWGAAQPGRFRSGVELVNVGVTVVDRDGKVISDLTADDFELYEEGNRQAIAYFARGDAFAVGDDDGASGIQRLRLGLLFDTSGSMDRDIQLSRTAAVRFLNSLQEAVDVTLVDFDTEVRVTRFEQASFPRLVERIRGRKPEGWTALYDALGTYLDGAYDLEGRKVLVIYSDGGDTRSATSFAESLQMLRASDVTVYVLGFLENQSTSVRSAQRMRLMQMAELTGGEAFFPTSVHALDQIYDRIASQIRAQYSLGYTPNNPRADGTWRRLQVRLPGKRHKGLKVRARPGYFAPLTHNP